MGFFEMTKTALKTVMSRPATILYPYQPAKKTGLTRGHVAYDGSKCISCSICVKKCPSQAILLNKEAKTWQIDRFRCVVCSSCVDTCPSKCLFMDTQYTGPAVEKSVEVFAITYVKPAKPEKKDEPNQ
ncbi:4Fe-4S dicluster domain-containing protein [Methanoregula sp.]|jgi:ech hydrogenase subunit F|uniref:4Fe-4S dicluster domain-containing protein n=1 Tax=Methanoregula sp. TaxID=2052170 RepID=UPI0025DBFF06|nr:4Fe-4S dicluster domain-containing protein [Methanoregula sp.]